MSARTIENGEQPDRIMQPEAEREALRAALLRLLAASAAREFEHAIHRKTAAGLRELAEASDAARAILAQTSGRG